MNTKQTIAILGATGRMGEAIAENLAKGNYRLLLKGSDKQQLDGLVDSIQQATGNPDVEAAVCDKDTCWEADIIVLAVPHHRPEQVANIKEVANQKLVVAIEDAEAISRGLLQNLLPYSRVEYVKHGDPEVVAAEVAAAIEAVTENM